MNQKEIRHFTQYTAKDIDLLNEEDVEFLRENIPVLYYINDLSKNIFNGELVKAYSPTSDPSGR